MRRDLHDGLGSALTSVTFQLDAACNLLDSNPQAVKNLLKELKAQTHASTCAMRLSMSDDALIVEVEDNGRPIPGNFHAGVGINAMRERAAELGGSCTVEALETGGTRVSAFLPLMKE